MSTMIPNQRSLRKALSALLFIGAALASIGTAHAKSTTSVDLYRIPEATKSQLERIPKNLARWHLGATLILVKDDQFQRIQVPDVGYFDESVFLSDNSALTYSIKKGQHDYIIDLGQFMTVSRFFLNNKSAAGSVQLMSSDTLEELNSGKWVTLTQPVDFQKSVLPSVSFPEVETRYVLVRFNIQSSGLIGNFGATGPLNITQAQFNIGKGEESTEVIKAKSPIIDYDFASGYTGTRIAFISGGPLEEIYNMVDEDPTTVYNFPSNEECVIVLDLRKETQMRTFAAQYTAKESGTLQVYMVDHLPTYFDSPQATGVATLTDTHGNVARAELASTDPAEFSHFLAAQQSRQIVTVPHSYFMEIEDSYTAHVNADEDRSVQIMDTLERRYVIFRFISEAMQSTNSIQTAKYVPSADRFSIQQAQSSPSSISFGQVEVIGDVEFDDLIYTLESEQGQPGGPPEDPPDDPPVISQ